ncbi:MAG: glycoside hydrolase family 15 protein [Thermoplasmata archaeon]|nr:glycoside hydrolase family 15 protein [Thermoplasmata archaeon]
MDPEEGDPWPDLYDYGVIGNLRTAALVSRFGTIDWACLPEFHSPSVFGRLLDRRGGGYCKVAPVGWQEALHRYVPGTNVLSTYFVLPGGTRLTLTDFMPLAPGFISEQEDRILRRIEAEGDTVEVEIEVDPRFDYGRPGRHHRTREAPDRMVWSQGTSRLTATGPWGWRQDGSRTIAQGPVEPGKPVYLTLDWGERAVPIDPEVLLRATVRFWQQWVRHPDAPLLRATHVWRDWVERSELLLKLLSNRQTGAFVAAPTTSLPEWWGGPRNWDYRYAWVRDAAFSAQSLFLLGHFREARTYVGWIIDRLTTAGPKGLATIYRASGAPVDVERRLDHWEGFHGSKPVRIGNAAGRQTQLDIFGEVLDAVEQLSPVDPDFIARAWPVLSRLVESAAHEWTRPDAGIWESRAPPLHYVHSKVMCWVALDRGRRIAERLGRGKAALRWGRVAETIHSTVLREGFDPARGSFVQAFDRRVVDASVLRIPMTGFLPYDDPKVLSTIAAVERELGDGPFVRRYRAEGSLHGPEGTFLLCAFWLVECLARSGQMDRAVQNFRRILRSASPLRLFPEEYDPKTRRPLGNYPQAFTHIGVLRAALAIGGGTRAARFAPPPSARSS